MLVEKRERSKSEPEAEGVPGKQKSRDKGGAGAIPCDGTRCKRGVLRSTLEGQVGAKCWEAAWELGSALWGEGLKDSLNRSDMSRFELNKPSSASSQKEAWD